MPAAELPDEPVVAWRESRAPWWAFGLELLLFGGSDRRREVTVSVNGIRADDRFVPWDQVEGIVEADDPDLATICCTDGRTVRLDRWHLPVVGAEDAKAERLDLLRRALAAGRTDR